MAVDLDRARIRVCQMLQRMLLGADALCSPCFVPGGGGGYSDAWKCRWGWRKGGGKEGRERAGAKEPMGSPRSGSKERARRVQGGSSGWCEVESFRPGPERVGLVVAARRYGRAVAPTQSMRKENSAVPRDLGRACTRTAFVYALPTGPATGGQSGLGTDCAQSDGSPYGPLPAQTLGWPRDRN